MILDGEPASVVSSPDPAITSGIPDPAIYLGHTEADGTLVLVPATVLTQAQWWLLGNPDLMSAIDDFGVNRAGTRRGRPRRRPTDGA